jgi:Tc5 transposase DNA-binding domain
LFCEYMASCNLAVDRPQVGRIARTLAKECGIKSFKASSTWIVDFLGRHGLTEKLCHGETQTKLKKTLLISPGMRIRSLSLLSKNF